MPKKVLLYARGGGIGHFNRAYSIAHSLKAHHQPALIFTSSALIADSMAEGLSILRWPGLNERPWQELGSAQIQSFIKNLNPDLVVSDTFENGPENELTGFQGQKLVIQRDGTQTQSPKHLLANPQGLGYVINTPLENLAPAANARHFFQATQHSPLVLVVHNGDPIETRSFFEEILYLFKNTPYQIRLCSLLPCLKPEWRKFWVRTYPLSTWYKGADLIIGGGGYNLVTETRCYGLRGFFREFERPVDNQWKRIATLPNFHKGVSKQHFLKKVSELISNPTPAPESQRHGAQQIAKQILRQL